MRKRKGARFRYDSGMDADPDPARDPFNFQESRRERGARRLRSHRHLVWGIAVVIVLLAATGLAVYFFVLKDRLGSPAPTTSTTVETSTTTSTAASSTTLQSTSTTLANLAPQTLKVTSSPQPAKLTITLQDGTAVSGKTPFSKDVPGGRIKIELSKTGYNSVTRELTLDQPADLKIWLDPQGQLLQSLVRFKCGSGPQQVAFSPDGRELWLALLNGPGLEVYSTSTGEKIGDVSLHGKGAAELVFSSDGQTVYATQMQTGTVFEIDRVSRTIKRELKTEGKSPKELVLSKDGKTLWTANWSSNDVSQIDLTTGKLVRRLSTVEKPRGLYVSSDGSKLYVGGCARGEVQRFDLATGKGKLIFSCGGAVWNLVADETENLLYADDNKGNAVWAIDLKTETGTKLAETDQRPNSMKLSADGKVLYVCNRGKENPKNAGHPGPEWGSVLAIDTSDGTILDAVVGGNQSTGLDVSSDGSLLAFSDFLDDHVSLYTIPPYATLAAGKGGRAPQRRQDIVKH